MKDRKIAAEKFKTIISDNVDEDAIGALIDVVSEWCCDLGAHFGGRRSAIALAKSIAADIEKEINKTFDIREGKAPN